MRAGGLSLVRVALAPPLSRGRFGGVNTLQLLKYKEKKDMKKQSLVITIIAAFVVLCALNAWAGMPYTFVDGDTARAADVNANFQYVDSVTTYKTGQTTSYATGDDGDLKKGTAWPQAERFHDNGNGTVTDKITGLIWLQNAHCFGSNWATALASANSLADGSCGLTDGSATGNWRLPNINELTSLTRFDLYGSVSVSDASTNHFTGVQSGYWSSSTVVGYPISAYTVFGGSAGYSGKTNTD